MYEYCSTWKLKVNAAKTKVIIFWRSNRFAKPKFTYGNQEIEIVDNYTYLGTIFAANGSFVKEKRHRVEQASKAMYFLLQKGRKLDLPFDMLCSLFDKLVVPILLYGAEVWCHESLEIIERLQYKFLRLALKVSYFVPMEMLLCETGRLPLSVNIKTKTVQFWARLLNQNGNKSKLSYQVYQLLIALDRKEVYTSPWIKFMKSILNDSGFSYLWDNQVAPNKVFIKSYISKSFSDQTVQNTLVKMNENSKCVNYRVFKHEISREAYIDTNNAYIIRTWADFRLGKMSYKMGTLGKCKLCNEASHDEFHILLECRELRELRERFMQRFFFRNPNVLKFNQLVNRCSENVKTRKKITTFLNEVMKML